MERSPLYDTFARAPLTFVRGEGCWLETDDGRRFLDFGSGIAVNSLGHANPRLAKVLSDQAARLWHVSNLYRIPEQERLAQLLCDASFADKVLRATSVWPQGPARQPIAETEGYV